jgi:hypothetical protein
MFDPGSTAYQRFVRPDGSWWNLHPLRVLSDDGARLLGWLPLGTPVIRGVLADGRDLRDAPLHDRFRLPCTRVPGTWTGTSTIRLIEEDVHSSVWWFFSPVGEFTGWYVNLEFPRGRQGRFLDRVDGILDVLVAPDGSAVFKDEDEALSAVDAGRLTGAELDLLRAEGDRRIEQARRGDFPFDGSWIDFRPDPDWPAPQLP